MLGSLGAELPFEALFSQGSCFQRAAVIPAIGHLLYLKYAQLPGGVTAGFKLSVCVNDCTCGVEVDP